MENASFKGTPGECALNPAVGIEKEYENMPKTGRGFKVIVIGAGPAGLTAAITLKRRGFEPVVWEKEKEAGGQVNIAASGPFKDKLHWAIEDMLTECGLLGIEIEYGKEATVQNIKEAQPYAVILATGGIPVRPHSIEGLDGENVVLAPDVLLGKADIKNKKVAVIGSGLTGLETTEKLNENGNEVTIVEMAKAVAENAWFQFVDDSMSRIEPYGTKILLETKLVSADKDGIVVEDKNGHRRIDVDTVVLSMGVRPNNALGEELNKEGIRCYAVGDADKGGTIGNATQSAFHTAMTV